MTPAITLDNVVCRFAGQTALDGLSLKVAAGEMFGLVGPDGAGKTTAIRLMCGLLKPDAGTVRVCGHDPAREHAEVTDRVGYLSQRFTLYGDLTVDENVAFFAEVHGVTRYHDRRDQLLEVVRLREFRTRLASQLSGGMKQKLALACTLVHEPEVLFLDEPTTGVDPASRREFWKLLSGLLARRLTILMSTPYLDEAERCSRVALLHEGRLLDADAPAAIRCRMPGRVVELSGVPMQLHVVRGLAGVQDAQVFGDRLHVTLADADKGGLSRFSNELERTPMAGVRVRTVPASLEDVFIAKLSRKQARP